MIEINLVPDVKQEFIRAKRVRNLVVSGAVLVGIAAIGIVVLLAVYLYGVQTLRSSLANDAIKENSSKLQKTPDLANILTIQGQLASLSSLHDQKNVGSRVFEVLQAINPSAPNQVTFSTVKFDATTGIVHLDAQAAGGYVAADVFEKTVRAITFTYQVEGDNNATSKPLVTDVLLSGLSYGEDASGKKVLRFSADLTYSPELFQVSSKEVRIERPDYQNATDSFKYLPGSLFSSRATDIGEGQ